MLRATAVVLLASLLAAPGHGQAGSEAPPKPRRFTVALQLGPTFAQNASALAEELRRAGYDDTKPEFCLFTCTGPTRHPQEHGAAVSATLSASYAISSAITVALGHDSFALGGATGYRAPTSSPGLGERVLSDWSGTGDWVSLVLTPDQFAHVAAGPAWYRLDDGNSRKWSRVGLMGEAGFRLAAGRGLFLDLAGRIHLLSSADVPLGSGAGALTLHPRWTHGSVQLGLGRSF